MLTTGLDQVSDALAFLRLHQAQSLCSDTRNLQAGDAFVAWPGVAHDARQYVGRALQSGACACLVDANHLETWGFEDARIGVVPQLQERAGLIADEFFDHPSNHLDVLAVTGTNGKTSTTWWLAEAMQSLARPCAVIGTLGIGLPHSGLRSTGLTTPDPIVLHRSLSEMRQAGIKACAIEASSIGIEEHRIAGLQIDVAIFTNFTLDHLDYHGSEADYWQAKAKLFAWPGLRAAVINVNDVTGAQLSADLSAHHHKIDLWTYAIDAPARLRASEVTWTGGRLNCVLTEGTEKATLSLHLVGQYNLQNCLAVIGGLRALGVNLAQAVQACSGLSPVPGRMQMVELAGAAPLPLVVVDYAHTPDALDQALRALRPVVQARGGRLWCVFGCGGNRDATKRPLMGAIATQLADCVVLTSDNPRQESPSYILSQIMAGMTGHDEVCVLEDRAEAITYALGSAENQDLILIAGKGHETTQEVQGVKHPFSDIEQVQQGLRRRVGL